MMRFTWTSLCLILCLIGIVGVSSTSAVEMRSGTEYGVEGNYVTVAWDVVSEASYYEARLVNISVKPNTNYAIAKTTEPTVVFRRPRTGDFIVEVRACNDKSADECEGKSPCCSQWINSLDAQYATVDGKAGGWWVWFKVPKPVVNP